ncbi:cyclase family protein [Actinospica robiniae]|uniref:cyclase family protein n=1 Tax=Actinospica robiniae TaxID=304901 RepID=UPI0004120E70|nr:cyclase family protein [Actinospica robiniae]
MCSPGLIESLCHPHAPTLGRRALLRSAAVLGAVPALVGAPSPSASAATPPPDPAPAVRGRVVDLTHELSTDFPVWLRFTEEPVTRQAATLAADGYNDKINTINEHTGTHIDAPLHFDDSGLSVAQLPAESLVAPLVVVRIAQRAAQDPTTELEVDDILAWERRYGRIPDGAFVAMDSGWSQRVSIPGAFLNYDADTGAYLWPGISPEAAAFLVGDRDVVGAGVDTTSLDTGTREIPLAHQTILPAGLYGVECLADLDQVPDSGAVLVVGAPKMRAGTGGPARVLAFV